MGNRAFFDRETLATKRSRLSCASQVPDQSLQSLVRSGLDALADLLDSLLDKLMIGIGALAFAGCQNAADVAPPPLPTQPNVSKLVPSEPVAPTEGPRELGQFTVTFYYVAGEDEPKLVAGAERNDNDTELAATAPQDLVTLFSKDKECEPIAAVSKEFAHQLAIQGTGKLHDGRVLNIWGHCDCEHTPCFRVTQSQWGTSGSGRPLQPFRTVAVDPKVIPLGSLLYVPLLEGRTMPGRPPWGGFVHDGCVVADDTGGHIGGNRIDVFVAHKAYFFSIGSSGSGGPHAWARHVPVFDGTGICERNGHKVGRKTGAI